MPKDKHLFTLLLEWVNLRLQRLSFIMELMFRVKYVICNSLRVLFHSLMTLGIQDETKATPLHYAISRSDFRLAELLVNSGAQLHIANKASQPPSQLLSVKLDQLAERENSQNEISALQQIQSILYSRHPHQALLFRLLCQGNIEAIKSKIGEETLKLDHLHLVSHNGLSALLAGTF
jgi:hypothetical protein